MIRSTRNRAGKSDRDPVAAGMKSFVGTFLDDTGLAVKNVRWRGIPADGSTRLFWRISCPGSDTRYIVMENPPDTPLKKRENLSFLKIGQHLSIKGLPIPEIYRADLVTGRFIMEDMGVISLQKKAGQMKNKIPLYKKTVEILIRLQVEGSEGFDEAWTCQTKRYDRTVMRGLESDYFREAFLCRYLGLEKNWAELERPFDHLAGMASRADNGFFLHRDFQSRNLMISEGKVGILDWQGGRLGPLAYDLASLLIDPYAALTIRERNQVFRYYLDLLRNHDPNWVGIFEEVFPYLAIQRNLQILGAFSFLTKVQKKPHFESYIIPAMKSLHGLLNDLKDPHLSPLEDLTASLLNK
jgi:aminoglycoside/choline kinase family phosphotransferase